MQAEAKSKVTKLLRYELMKLFKEPDEVDFVDEDYDEFQNRTGAFGMLLNLTQGGQPNTDTLHKQVIVYMYPISISLDCLKLSQVTQFLSTKIVSL